MWENAQDAYLEQRVLSADPLELVRLLYQAAIAAVRDARRALSAGEIAARSRSISKACGIVLELNGRSTTPKAVRSVSGSPRCTITCCDACWRRIWSKAMRL